MAVHHPLQRLASPSGKASALVHLAGIASFSASFAWLILFPSPMATLFGGQFQFLTILGLTASMLTFVTAFLADITGSQSLFAIKNRLSVGSAPLEVLVSILYWGLTVIDKSLVVPPGLEYQLPLLPDLGFHAMPAIMMTLDLLLFSPPWTIRGYSAMTLSLVIAFLYWGWIELCFSKNGVYPYPIFELLTTWQRVVLFAFSAGLMTLSTLALKFVYGKLNGIEELKEEAKHPLKAK